VIVSINPTTYSANPGAPTAAPASSVDAQAFSSKLSAASSTQNSGSSAAKPGGSVIHDRKVHHSASSKSADTVPDSTPATAPAASPSTLPPMAPTTRSAEAQPKTDAAADGGGFPATQPESAARSDAPQPADGDPKHLPASADAASQPSNGSPADHEATLRDAIATAQNGSMTTGVLSAGQAAASVATLASFPLSGVPLKGIKGQPTTQAASAPGTVPSATADRQHKAAAADDSSNTDSSGTSQGSSSDQPGTKPLVADMTLPQDGPLAAHTGPVAALPVSVAPAPVHTGGPVQTAPAPAALVPAAYLGMLQPDALATPFVSSARLIQSIQQSDMRVGLNSLEFGAISIHTSTDRGVISSQITLGHEELARTISSHLSALQETPGIPQVFSVRVDTSSPPAGDSSGPSQHSPGDRQQQQTGRTAQSRSTELQPRLEYNLPIPVRNLDGLNARLDIRI